MADFEQIVEVARSQGITQRRLAKLLEINPGHLWRLKAKGEDHRPSPELVRRAVRLLGIGAQDVLSECPGWLEIAKDDLGRLAVYNEQLSRADSVLTISSFIESYLQQEWMLEYSNRIWLGIGDWDDHQRYLLPYAQQQKQARSQGNFLHRVVCPWQLFQTAKVQAIDWLAEIRLEIGDAEQVCAVTPIRDWAGFRERISALLPAEAARWGKVCVIDSVRIMVHMNGQCYFSTSHEATARHLKGELDSIIQTFDPGFLRESQLKRKTLRESALANQDRIERLLRTDDELEMARPYLKAFAYMLKTGQFMSAATFARRARKVFPDPHRRSGER